MERDEALLVARGGEMPREPATLYYRRQAARAVEVGIEARLLWPGEVLVGTKYNEYADAIKRVERIHLRRGFALVRRNARLHRAPNPPIRRARLS
jgi:hypothetical protein